MRHPLIEANVGLWSNLRNLLYPMTIQECREEAECSVLPVRKALIELYIKQEFNG